MKKIDEKFLLRKINESLLIIQIVLPFGGEHEWWNMHPAKFPNEHQAGIHGTGSPANELFKGGKKK
ncbi:hypothetical protein P4478_17130 [Bacillus subtilis]|nr:hypothetical protein [Bacillus subtilis]